MENHSTVVLPTEPQADTTIQGALIVLQQSLDYGQVMVSQEMQLAAQISELQRTDTVVLALQGELRKRLAILVQRRDALARCNNSRY